MIAHDAVRSMDLVKYCGMLNSSECVEEGVGLQKRFSGFSSAHDSFGTEVAHSKMTENFFPSVLLEVPLIPLSQESFGSSLLSDLYNSLGHVVIVLCVQSH